MCTCDAQAAEQVGRVEIAEVAADTQVHVARDEEHSIGVHVHRQRAVLPIGLVLPGIAFALDAQVGFVGAQQMHVAAAVLEMQMNLALSTDRIGLLKHEVPP